MRFASQGHQILLKKRITILLQIQEGIVQACQPVLNELRSFIAKPNLVFELGKSIKSVQPSRLVFSAGLETKLNLEKQLQETATDTCKKCREAIERGRRKTSCSISGEVWFVLCVVQSWALPGSVLNLPIGITARKLAEKH